MRGIRARQGKDGRAAIIGAAVLVGVAGVAAVAAARSPWFVESVYAARLGPAINLAQTGLSGRVPFSLAELLGFAVAAWLGAAWARVAWRAVHGRGAELRADLAMAVRRTVATGGVAIALFYALWGVQYARPDLVARLGWARYTSAPEDAGAAAAELAALAADLVDAANADYRAAFGSGDLGVPSDGRARAAEIDRAIDAGFARVAARLGEPDAFARPRGPAKPLALSIVLSLQGLVGVYAPWTGEANYNAHAPGHEIPHAMAHEKAHQRGITREDEANFVGYLACDASPDAFARYAGHLFAQRQILRELDRFDPDAASALVARRLPGVQRDVDASRAYWARFDGPARRAQTRTNDAFLKLHGMPDGVGAYGRSVTLLVAFARANGGRVAR